jgi:AcrR family transcriptional regulator
VLHRALFGWQPGVNARLVAASSAPEVPISQDLRDTFERVRALQVESEQPSRRALASLLAVGDEVVVRFGYKGVRVEDVTTAAGVSRGAFYLYFENIDAFVRIVTIRAVLDITAAFAELPDADDIGALRQWLWRYTSVPSPQVALMRIWIAAGEDSLRHDPAAVIDGVRRQLMPLLNDREVGDADADAVVLLAMVEASSLLGSPLAIDGAMRIIERGFLGQDR